VVLQLTELLTSGRRELICGWIKGGNFGIRSDIIVGGAVAQPEEPHAVWRHHY
jgi:hypothetical protein